MCCFFFSTVDFCLFDLFPTHHTHWFGFLFVLWFFLLGFLFCCVFVSFLVFVFFFFLFVQHNNVGFFVVGAPVFVFGVFFGLCWLNRLLFFWFWVHLPSAPRSLDGDCFFVYVQVFFLYF